MGTIIRDNRSTKGAVNGSRERFLRRYRKHIKRAVQDSVNKGSIKSVGDGGIDITIPKRDMSEPHIVHDPKTGRKQGVHPGNKEFVTGDHVQRPKGGGGGGAGEASNQGEGDDDFTFHLSEDEFYTFLFEGLELPNFNKVGQQNSTKTVSSRSGIVSEGQPNNMDLVRSIQKRMGRGFALSGKKNGAILDLWEQKLHILDKYDDTAVAAFEAATADQIMTRGMKIKQLEKHIDFYTDQFNGAVRNDFYGDTADLDLDIESLMGTNSRKLTQVPWNEIDLKYRNFEKKPIKVSKAVMFCIMDVSGSMNQQTKENAKLFYILLHKFLKKHYDQTEVVFIRHHTSAKEVDEQEFFYGRETGGTIVSSGLQEMLDIIQDRYSPTDWNIYGAQASDGDNWQDDSPNCISRMDKILDQSQGFWYTEITQREPQELWHTYKAIADRRSDKFWLGKIEDRQDIPTIFREFFKKKGESISVNSYASPSMS